MWAISSMPIFIISFSSWGRFFIISMGIIVFRWLLSWWGHLSFLRCRQKHSSLISSRVSIFIFFFDFDVLSFISLRGGAVSFSLSWCRYFSIDFDFFDYHFLAVRLLSAPIRISFSIFSFFHFDFHFSLPEDTPITTFRYADWWLIT